MKLLTLNVHSHMEEQGQQKLMWVVSAILKERPDVIALQEVSQSVEAEIVSVKLPGNYRSCNPDIRVKCDNYVWNVVKSLALSGLSYEWTWLPVKLGYDKLEEGVALLSLFPITKTEEFYLSGSRNFKDWHTRKALGISVSDRGLPRWFYSIHMGWWQEEGDSFPKQWERLKEGLVRHGDGWITLMGDFNNPAEIRGRGYDYMMADGWVDTYQLSGRQDQGITVSGCIDGWREQKNLTDMRIDYILQNKCVNDTIASSCVVFNGINYQIVSDHYGVLVVE